MKLFSYLIVLVLGILLGVVFAQVSLFGAPAQTTTQLVVDGVSYDAEFPGGVVFVDDPERDLPIEWDAGFVGQIDGLAYVVCPHGYTEEGLWWGYVVPVNAEVVHCLNDPEPVRITELPEG